jgi:cobalt/nickel transport system ATP-binding protein
MTVPVIEFDHVSFAYEAQGTVLDGVDLSIASGEVVALKGPNGSGKSTSLRLMIGLDYAQAGTVRAFGSEITKESMRDRAFAKRLHQRMGLVFQDPECMLFNPTVAQEIAFGPTQMGLSTEEVNTRVNDCLEIFALTHLKHRSPWRLSGGEKRRCALACVASMAPEVLLLDEPTNDLDDKSRDLLIGFLVAFHQAGKTIVVSTHESELIDDLSARTISFL